MATEEHFSAHDGAQLFARRWAVDAPRASVVIVHGYGEHCGRYEDVAQFLNGLGCSVFAYDQRGHGRSPGKRGFIRRFAALPEDLHAFLQHVAPAFEDRAVFLLGHSMGGLVLAHYMLAHALPVRGLIFSSPLLKLHAVSPLLLRLSPVLSLLTPWLPVARVDPEGLSREPTVVATYRADPFVYHGRIGARTGAELHGAVEEVRAGLDRLGPPLYILHGTEDPLVPAEGSQDLHRLAGAADKTLRLYEGGYHEQFHDLEKARVLEELGDWLVSHC
jgi:acylglycerol lipase